MQFKKPERILLSFGMRGHPILWYSNFIEKLIFRKFRVLPYISLAMGL